MSKNPMLRSHSEMFGPEPDYPKNLVSDYQVRGTEEYYDDKRMKKKSVIQTIHPQDKFAGLKASDFLLENIISVGALDSLKECYLSENSIEAADNFEVNADKIISAIDSESNSNDGGNE